MKFPQRSQDFCRLLGIRYPLVQAGMVWVSGGNLAQACSNAGILGVIGSGSMGASLLGEHIDLCQKKTSSPFGVNVPLLYPGVEQKLEVALGRGVRIFITSAGNPKTWTPFLKKQGAKVIHVVSHPDQAQKSEQAGCDAVVAEGFEAGGHNGRDEITSLVLIPQVAQRVSIPVIGAGGFASGASVVAGLALGASAIQMGSRFVCAQESSAHPNFQQAIIDAGPGDTQLVMKSLTPVRLLKNRFFQEIEKLEKTCAPPQDLLSHLGKGRAKKGMFEGDLEEGELEIGQISGALSELCSAKKMIEKILTECYSCLGEWHD